MKRKDRARGKAERRAAKRADGGQVRDTKGPPIAWDEPAVVPSADVADTTDAVPISPDTATDSDPTP